MNCSQARILLAAYHELKNDKADTTALDAHLEQCSACRNVLAQTQFVGDGLRMLPTHAPSADARMKLMQALAAEHTRFLQSSPTTAPSPPDFLKPYMHERAQMNHKNEALAAFSTAETGPLPILHPKRKAHRRTQINQFAVIGLAASFLLIIMASGLVALLLLANHTITPTASINQPAQVAMAHYTTTSDYTHVVSAVANQEHIYYTAYGKDSNAWMLEQVNNQSMPQDSISMPLLESMSQSPLIVLGSSENWVVWLQFDLQQTAQSITHNHIPTSDVNDTRTWALRALPIGPQQRIVKDSLPSPVTILTGTFDKSTVPGWVHTPIQGLSLTQNTMFLGMIDNKGDAHLLSYQLDNVRGVQSKEIASAKNGHILTSPTVNSDSNVLYWSEEWQGSDGVMYSNVWSQITSNVEPTYSNGKPRTLTSQYLFRGDGMSFQPQIVNNTLFVLSTADATSFNAAVGTPVATQAANAVATPTSATNSAAAAIVNRIDATIYPSQPDAAIHGTILAFTSDNTLGPPIIFSGNTASALQGGSTFLFWQSEKGYEMYDVVAKSPVIVAKVPAGADFLAVNPDSAVWTDSTDITNQSITFRMFQWPLRG